MKTPILIFLSIASLTFIRAQTFIDEDVRTSDDSRWVHFESDVYMSADDFLTTYLSDLGLSDEDSFRESVRRSDALGQEHIRMDQLHRGVPVEGAQYIVHREEDRILTVNGRPVKGLDLPPQPLINADKALELALDMTAGESYYWEDPEKERLLKEIRDDEDATFYPQPELVYADPHYSMDGKNYRLAWKIDIHVSTPGHSSILFIDATSGQVLYEVSACKENGVEGHGRTRYYGERHFMTDTLANGQYILRDPTRGSGIETYNTQRLPSDTIPWGAVDFISDSTYWMMSDEDLDDAALDAHWGVQKSYDYFMEYHNWSSFDGNGARILSYIHVGQNWFNARWTGSWMEFGDGNNNPLTSIDIVAHELTHGVTDHTSDLVYRNESGALNESFSDIFGNLVEWYALEDSLFDWQVGLDNFTLRNMANPKAQGDPDTYMGENWVTGEADNGGVHTNSGVQNYWFYLLAEGGEGVNDNGDAYDLEGLGMESAAAIAFRNQLVYLTPSSTYVDARRGAILSAEDLFGPCSEEVYRTAYAWYAVGVGGELAEEDLEMNQVSEPAAYSCEFSDEEYITVEATYLRTGCDEVIMPDAQILFGYSLNDTDPVVDTTFVQDTIHAGDMLRHTFASPVDMNDPAFYDFDFFISYEGDENPDNNILGDFTITKVGTVDSSVFFDFDEFLRPAVPSHTPVSRTQSHAGKIQPSAFSGYLELTGGDVNVNNLDTSFSVEENFDVNPDYESRICYCIDAMNWDSLWVHFDIRQRYSDVYSFINLIPEAIISKSIAMRLIADEMPVSQQYHPPLRSGVPDSIDLDTFRRESVSLHHLAGSSFDLCFQGKHYFSRQADFLSSGGDYTHLDNVEFIFKNQGQVSTDASPIEALGPDIFPNPVEDIIMVKWKSDPGKDISIQVLDATGRTLKNKKFSPGREISVSTGDLSQGLYFLEIQNGTQRFVRKFIKF